jgi:DNA-directed RNA polymerase subunit RPC12/RpoP
MPVIGCPDCDHHFRVGDLPPGATVRCTNCGSRMAMPDRALRKRARPGGAYGGRSDYIDAEDVIPDRPRRKKDKLKIALSNAFTVFIIVGTTGLTILLVVGGGYLLHTGTRGPLPAAPAVAAPAAADVPVVAAPPAADPGFAGGPVAEPVGAGRPAGPFPLARQNPVAEGDGR